MKKPGPKQTTLIGFFSKVGNGKDVSSDAESPPGNEIGDEDKHTVDDDIEEDPKSSKSKGVIKAKSKRGKGRGKKKDSDDESSDDDGPSSNKENKKEIAYHLPPMHDLPTIFSDLVSHAPQVDKVAKWISGRKLRVATMCSGTESPLLALELIRRSILAQHGINLDIEHVFSCEIEPFKQAYIERNFHPPLLFRDVCELGNGEAYVYR